MKQKNIKQPATTNMLHKSPIFHLAICLATWIVIGSCERRPLEDELRHTALIPVKVYWDNAGITAHNATILFYRPDGTLYKEKNFAGSDDTYAETEIELEIGQYTVVVFNEKRNQIDYVAMQGHEHLSTFQAYVTNAFSVFNTFSRAAGKTLVNQPGHLAVWKGEVIVTLDMVSRSRNRSNNRALDENIDVLTNLHPSRKTAVANLSARINGLNNARMPALVELRNMAQGYHFATDRNTLIPVTVQFKMNNRQYDPGSYTEGTIRESIVTFGLPGIRTEVHDLLEPIYLDFSFKLIDVDQTPEFRSYNVTDLIQVVGNEYRIDINVHLTFPTPLPDVIPENASGMEAETVEWKGEIIGIELGKSN